MAIQESGSMNPPLARLSGLSKFFGGVAVLNGVDLTIGQGEVVALVGRSGSGKSTLLRIVAGLDDDFQGERAVLGSAAVAFQEPRLLPWKRVKHNVALGLAGSDAVHRAELVLADVGLAHRSTAWPLTLSGGEAQRASLARALVREPSLLLLDEPFGALDALTRITVQELTLKLWSRRRFGVLLVTHDVEEAVLLADRVLVLEAGRIKRQVRVDRPRPRDRKDPQLLALREQLLELLGVFPSTIADQPNTFEGVAS